MDRLQKAIQIIKENPEYRAVHALTLGRALSDDVSPIADLLFIHVQGFDSYWKNLSPKERKTEPNKEQSFKTASNVINAWLFTPDGQDGEFTHPNGPMHIMEALSKTVYESKMIEVMLDEIEEHIPRLQAGLYAAALNPDLKNNDFIQQALQRNFTLTKECDVLSAFISSKEEFAYAKFMAITIADRMRGVDILHSQGFDFGYTKVNVSSNISNPLAQVMAGERHDSFLARAYLACKRNPDNERLFLRMLELQQFDPDKHHVMNDKKGMTLLELVKFCHEMAPNDYPDMTASIKALVNKHAVTGLLEEMRATSPKIRA